MSVTTGGEVRPSATPGPPGTARLQRDGRADVGEAVAPLVAVAQAHRGLVGEGHAPRLAPAAASVLAAREEGVAGPIAIEAQMGQVRGPPGSGVLCGSLRFVFAIGEGGTWGGPAARSNWATMTSPTLGDDRGRLRDGRDRMAGGWRQLQGQSRRKASRKWKGRWEAGTFVLSTADCSIVACSTPCRCWRCPQRPDEPVGVRRGVRRVVAEFPGEWRS